MIRVFLACDDQDYGNKICRQLQNQRNLVVFPQTEYGIPAIRNAVEFVPDVVILVASDRDEREITGAVKSSLPDVPVFLVTERFSLEVEKDALSSGVEAVFEKHQDLESLITNVRAISSL